MFCPELITDAISSFNKYGKVILSYYHIIIMRSCLQHLHFLLQDSNGSVCMLSCSVISNSFQPLGLQPNRLLCPWNSPDRSTGVGCHFLFQGSPQSRDRTHVSYISCIAWQVLYHQHKLGSQLYPYSGMFYSAVNRNENLAHATEWMKLEYISLGKMSDIKR